MPTVKTLIPKCRQQEQQIRVAAYCRVSSDSEDQKHSFLSQMQYYTELIDQTPNWTLADIYAER